MFHFDAVFASAGLAPLSPPEDPPPRKTDTPTTGGGGGAGVELATAVILSPRTITTETPIYLYIYIDICLIGETNSVSCAVYLPRVVRASRVTRVVREHVYYYV